MKSFLAVFAALLLAACAQKEQITTTVNQQEQAQYNKPGTATVTGSALLRQQGGGVVTCAGNEVFLMADIPVSRQIVAVIRRGNIVEDGPSLSARYPHAFRKSVCNAQGFFRFDNLAAGNWQLVTAIIWTVGYYNQGGWLGTQFTIGEGETRDVVLGNSNLLR